MKTLIIILISCFLLSSGCLSLSSEVVAADIDGTWKGAVPGPDGNPLEITYVFKSSGNDLSGTVSTKSGNGPFSGGRIEGNNISFSVEIPGTTVYANGTLSGDMINMTQKKGSEVNDFTLKRVRDEEKPGETSEGTVLEPDEMKLYEGEYSSTLTSFKITLKIINNRLHWQPKGQSAFPLNPVSKTEFKFKPGGVTILFSKGSDGKIQFDSFVIEQRGRRTTFIKTDGTLKFSNLDELHSYIQNKVENNEFSGTVLIAKDGNPIFKKAYGYASKRFKVPNKLDTKFNLASVNKLFTSVAIAQLMEKGKLSIDDPIGKYLDIFPEEIAEKVTIRHLLNMRSGWGDYWSNEYYQTHRDRLHTVSDYMEFIKDIPLNFEPGTNYQHCNTGFEVAGAVIEAVTGVDYFDYVRKNIYERSGMANTDSYYRNGPVENLAVGYFTNMRNKDPEGKEYQWENTYFLSPRGTPAGGGYSTIYDLLKFANALNTHKLLNPEYTNYFLNRFQGLPGDPISSNRNAFQGGRGLGLGSSAFFGMNILNDYTIVILSNYDTPVITNLTQEIIKMLGRG